MMNPLRDLSDWIAAFADSDWSVVALALTSFSEAIFFPVPPDLLLIGIAVRHSEAALWLAALTTASSVVGAVIAHRLGRRFGRPLLHRLVSETRVAVAERMFQKHGVWAILVAAFTPIPYKVFAISAGVLGLNTRTFVIASVVGRGARFFLLGGLLFAFGDSIEDFIYERFEIITLAAAAGLVLILGALFVLARRRRVRGSVGGGTC